MIQLPIFLKPFEKDAYARFAEGAVCDVEFSGNTYQVQIFSPQDHTQQWVFVQLDAMGQIANCFCSCEHECEEVDHVAYCVHIAIAFLYIYNGTSFPLHVRFARSFWNCICSLFAERFGDDPSVLERRGNGFFELDSTTGKKIFYIKGKDIDGRHRVDTIVTHTHLATESTSLKFSNLSQEELELWREGHPSPKLKYELSFWNEIAHWLMWQQDNQVPYEINFAYSTEQLPCFASVSFPKVEVGFYLSRANLSQIIPTLATVRAPLKIYYLHESTINHIFYDKKTATMIIQEKKVEPSSARPLKEIQKPHVLVDGWEYVPFEGFYAKEEHELLSKKKWSVEEIPALLEGHLATMSSLIEGAVIHRTAIPLLYALTFDADWNLHIIAYLFNPGDLSAADSKFFKNWVYLDDDGFYPISEAHFPHLETVLHKKEISDFIRREKSWLNMQEGFYIHLANMEAIITYDLTTENRLHFEKKTAPHLEEKSSKDFGDFIYVAGEGFYPKSSPLISLPLAPYLDIPPHQIPSFIRMHHAELELISGFFGERSPLVGMGLRIELQKNEEIHISPECSLQAGYEKKDIRFFDEFVYVEDEGFSELPSAIRLPERFRQEVIVSKKEAGWFLIHDLPTIRPYIVFLDPRLCRPREMHLSALKIEKNRVEKNIQYYLKLIYQTETASIPISKIWTHIQKKKRFLFSEAGFLDLEEKRFDWIRRISKEAIDSRTNTVELNIRELIRLTAFEQINTQDPEAQQLLKGLEQQLLTVQPSFAGLKSQLRPYQTLGAKWLWFLYQHGLSGLLCDDMGLGKTHQAMALLAAALNQHKQGKVKFKSAPFLVVCPTSVIYHWEEKLREFLPDLRVRIFYGTLRSLDQSQEEYDLILTSYGTLRMEQGNFNSLYFDIAIFDEMQVAKNSQARIHAILLGIKAQMCLGLTGTPIENYLRELKSLFDIILPAYMPGEQEFRELFIKPIEKQENRQPRLLLRRLIDPFVLRRKKEDVLTDLPEKMEEIVHCHMLPDQLIYYQQVLEGARQPLLEQLQDEGTAIPYIHIFSLLSKLKQICNHPAAYLKTPADYKEHESGKWELFKELLSEARDSKQKVVVFSQYLAMIEIFSLYLNEIGVSFALIQGDTKDRGAQIHRFNHDPTCEVFIGSLMTAGLGVDLTAGSVVIHYDRWWNAARENQATDRVHRIGQTRGVQVFKLVTKHSFEERIDELINRKRKLFEELIRADDHLVLKQFNRDELRELLRDVMI